MDKKIAVKAILEKIKNENDGQHIDYMVPGYTSKKLKTYQSMRGDLIICRDATVRLIAEKFDHTITTSLYHTIIVLYGKCFTDASSSKSPKLEIKDCFDENNEELYIIHKDIIDLRNNFAAHRGSTEHEVGLAYLKLNIKDFSRQVRVKQLKRRMPKDTDLPLYLKLFDHLIVLVEKKFEREGNKVWDHMLNEYTAEDLAMFKIAGPKVEPIKIDNKTVSNENE